MYSYFKMAVLVICLLFFTTISVSASDSPWDLSFPVPQYDPLWEKVKETWQDHFEQNNVDLLIEILNLLEKKYPDRAEIDLWLSRVYFLKGKYEKKLKKDYFELSEFHAARVLSADKENEVAWAMMMAAVSAHRNLDDFKKKYPDYLTHIRRPAKRALNEMPPSDIWTKAISHWDRREDPQDAVLAVDLFRQMADSQPGNMLAQLWAARGNYYVGYYYTSLGQHDIGLPFYKNGEKYGKKALAINPYSVSANYWRQLNLARSIEETNILNKATHLKTLMNHLVFAANENPAYFYVGPVLSISTMVLKGGWVAEKGMAMAGYEMENVATCLEFGALMYPDYFYIHLARAMVLYNDGKKEAAEEMIKNMLAMDPLKNKYHAPENLCVLRIARQFLEEMK